MILITAKKQTFSDNFSVMNARSPELRKVLLAGTGGLFVLGVASAEVQPVENISRNTETSRAYAKSLEDSILEQSQLPATLATATPRALPTIARPRVLPTIAPRNPVPARPAPVPTPVPEALQSQDPNSVDQSENAATPEASGEQTPGEGGSVMHGPPMVPEKGFAERFAESFTTGSSIMLQIIYGMAAFGAGYAAKKYLRP